MSDASLRKLFATPDSIVKGQRKLSMKALFVSARPNGRNLGCEVYLHHMVKQLTKQHYPTVSWGIKDRITQKLALSRKLLAIGDAAVWIRMVRMTQRGFGVSETLQLREDISRRGIPFRCLLKRKVEVGE